MMLFLIPGITFQTVGGWLQNCLRSGLSYFVKVKELPPHVTDKTQLLDVACFGPLIRVGTNFEEPSHKRGMTKTNYAEIYIKLVISGMAQRFKQK